MENTGIVYEFFDRTGSVVRTIAGGGRYDQLVESFGGGLIPCTGIGMGETVLLSILKQLGRIGEYSHPAKVYVAPISKDVFKESAEIANMLREEFEIIFNPFGWNLKKQLQDAGTRKIPLMVIVGKRDLEEKKVDVGGWGNRDEAIKIVNQCIERHDKSDHKKNRTFTI